MQCEATDRRLPSLTCPPHSYGSPAEVIRRAGRRVGLVLLEDGTTLKGCTTVYRCSGGVHPRLTDGDDLGGYQTRPYDVEQKRTRVLAEFARAVSRTQCGRYDVDSYGARRQCTDGVHPRLAWRGRNWQTWEGETGNSKSRKGMQGQKKGGGDKPRPLQIKLEQKK